MPVGKVIYHWVSEVKWEVGLNRIETSDQKPKNLIIYIFSLIDQKQIFNK